MKTLLKFLIVLSIAAASLFALLQSLKGDAVTFTKILGENRPSKGINLFITDDNGYLVIGTQSARDKSPAGLLFVKLDESGEVESESLFSNKLFNNVKDIQKTADGNFIIIGSSKGGNKSTRAQLIKINDEGGILWKKTYEGGKHLFGSAVRQTSDGGFVLLCTYTHFNSKLKDLYVIRVDSVGGILWERAYGGADNDLGSGIIQTSDGGFISYGKTKSFGLGEYDMIIIKTGKDGSLQWDRTIGGLRYDAAHSAVETDDGAYLILGWSDSSGTYEPDTYLIKLNKNGDLIWDKALGRKHLTDRAFELSKTSDGGYILLGYIRVYDDITLPEKLGLKKRDKTKKKNQNQNLYLIKVDKDGNKEWENTFGGKKMERATAVRQTPDGGYILLGETASFGAKGTCLYVVKTDKDGNTNIW